MPRNTTLDTILQSRHLITAFRVLTVDVDWPAGTPPFASGAVSVPAVPETPDAYSAAGFVAADWTDVSGLVTEYHYGQSIEQQCDVLTLTVPCAWAESDLDRAFRSMRAVLVQERYSGGGADTGWLNVAWCLSTGYAQRWEAGSGAQMWTVNALDAQMLAGLDLLGTESGSAVYEPDRVQVGRLSVDDRYTLTMIDDSLPDAWEYAVLDADDAIQPNWAPTPPPQFWVHNVPDESEPISLAIADDAVQAVFGEGVLRLSKAYARAEPRTDPGDAPDYAIGLGFDELTVPDVRGVVTRYAHPAITDRDGNTLAADIAGPLAQAADPPVAGQVAVSGDYSALPQGLTLLLLDGSGARYLTSSHSYDAGSDLTTFILGNTAALVATGSSVQYGDANRAVDVVRRWLLESGFQVGDNTAAFYAATPAAPQLQGVDVPLILAPLVFREEEAQTRLQALADLRSAYAVIPSWQTRADAAGQIHTASIQQTFDSATGPNAAILPLWIASDAACDKTDLQVFTRVVARGRARQATDLTLAGVTTSEPNAAAGGLPAVNGSRQVTIGATTYTLQGVARRTATTGDSYTFDLATLFSAASEPSTQGKKNRPWGWYYRAARNATGKANARILRDAWQGAIILEMTLPAPVSISALELQAPNAWWSDTTDWGGNRHTDPIGGGFGGSILLPGTMHLNAHADNQVLTVEYYDSAQMSWRPLVSHLTFPVDLKARLVIEEDQFDTRAAVTTDRLRLRVVEPFFAENDTKDESWYHVTVGVFLRRFIAWSSDILRGVAEIGETAPFTGDFWESVASRLRQRTYLVTEIADWANTQALVDSLAVDWLYDVTRNLAARPVTAVRPDARLGDTVRLFLPSGQAVCYGDGDAQTSGWRLYGVTMAHSDALLLYWSLTNSGSTRTLRLYANSARTVLVAQGSRSGDGVLTLAAQGGSGISGRVTVAYTGDDTGTVAAPTYLVVGVERGAAAGQPGPGRLNLVNYTEPYFES